MNTEGCSEILYTKKAVRGQPSKHTSGNTSTNRPRKTYKKELKGLLAVEDAPHLSRGEQMYNKKAYTFVSLYSPGSASVSTSRFRFRLERLLVCADGTDGPACANPPTSTSSPCLILSRPGSSAHALHSLACAYQLFWVIFLPLRHQMSERSASLLSNLPPTMNPFCFQVLL